VLLPIIVSAIRNWAAQYVGVMDILESAAFVIAVCLMPWIGYIIDWIFYNKQYKKEKLK
jgi:hypothetical protein